MKFIFLSFFSNKSDLHKYFDTLLEVNMEGRHICPFFTIPAGRQELEGIICIFQKIQHMYAFVTFRPILNLCY